MQIISFIGFFLALILIMLGSMKGYHIILLTLLSSLLVIITNGMPLADSLLAESDSYMAGITGFVGDYFIIFLLSAILAKYIDKSGGARSIGHYILSKTGRDQPYLVLVAIFIFSALLTLGGVSIFVAMFVVVPLARPLFKELDMSWKLVATPYFMGVGSFTMTLIPGTPAIQNVIMADALGTTLTAAPVFGLVLTVFLILFTLWRMKVELNESLERGEGFESRFDQSDEEANGNLEEADLPSFAVSVLPLLALFVAIIIGSSMGIENILPLALALSVVICLIVFNPYIKDHQSTINEGILSSLSSVMAPAATLGFGTVMTISPTFESIMSFFETLALTPLLSLLLIALFLQLIIASASGVLSVIGERFIPLYDLSAYDPGFVHRMVATTPAVLPPQVGAYLSFLEVSGLNHKDTFKQVTLSLNLGIVLTVVLGYIIGLVFY